MEKKTTRQLLHEVDPNLKVVSARHHQKGEQQWLAATGITCAGCGREVFQSRDGLCMKCWEEKQDKIIEIRDKTGLTELYGPDFLPQITHKAKNDPK